MIRLVDGNAVEQNMIKTIANMMKTRRWMRKDQSNEDEILAVIQNAPTINLNTLRDEVYADAVVHGLYDGEYDVPELERAAPGLMYRIQDEVREAWNAALDWQQGKKDAKDHVAEELADIIITALSVSGHLGINIDAALRRKVDINKKRPYKHKE